MQFKDYEYWYFVYFNLIITANATQELNDNYTYLQCSVLLLMSSLDYNTTINLLLPQPFHTITLHLKKGKLRGKK